MKKRKLVLEKRFLVFAVIIIFGFIIFGQQDLFARCEAALARLQQAEAQLNAANIVFNNANQKAEQAQANLAQAVANLNAVAAKLGVPGTSQKYKSKEKSYPE